MDGLPMNRNFAQEDGGLGSGPGGGWTLEIRLARVKAEGRSLSAKGQACCGFRSIHRHFTHATFYDFGTWRAPAKTLLSRLSSIYNFKLS